MKSHSLKMSFLENRDPQLVQPQDVPNLEKVDHEIQIIENSFPKRTMKILGILQIICGVLVIGLQILPYFIISTGTNIHSVIWHTCTGIIFITSGIIGFNNGFKPSKNGMIAFLVLNIISIFFTWGIIGKVSIAISFSHLISSGFFPSSYKYYDKNDEMDIILSTNCLLLIISLLQVVTATVAAGFSCAAVQCCCKESSHPGNYSGRSRTFSGETVSVSPV